MTAPDQYPGNQRWGIHTSNPHTNCWCAQQQDAVRNELVRMVGPTAADHLLADHNLRIELTDDAR